MDNETTIFEGENGRIYIEVLSEKNQIVQYKFSACYEPIKGQDDKGGD